jgi:signal transduction histidine kinase
VRSIEMKKNKKIVSLSYDIVKAHGGELSVETKEGEETKFIIQLPASIDNYLSQ